MELHYNNLNLKLDNLMRKQRKTKYNSHKTENQFYNRTVNLTPIQFNPEETAILNKGMQFSIEQPLNRYWNDLIINTNQAIRKLEPRLQEAYKTIASKKLKQIENSNHRNKQAKQT